MGVCVCILPKLLILFSLYSYICLFFFFSSTKTLKQHIIYHHRQLFYVFFFIYNFLIATFNLCLFLWYVYDSEFSSYILSEIFFVYVNEIRLNIECQWPFMWYKIENQFEDAALKNVFFYQKAKRLEESANMNFFDFNIISAMSVMYWVKQQKRYMFVVIKVCLDFCFGPAMWHTLSTSHNECIYLLHSN